MSKPFIVIGDKTTHGGTVISADFTTDIRGKAMARVGDKVVCPQCKGVFAINSGADDVVDGEGRAYARHMDTTDCGARLIAAQATTTWSNKSSSGGGASGGQQEVPVSASEVAAPTKSGICLECLVSAAESGSSTVIRD